MPTAEVVELDGCARVGVGMAATALGCLAYVAGYEVQAYRLRRVDVPVLPAGQRPLRVLHVSDLHMTPAQNRKRGDKLLLRPNLNGVLDVPRDSNGQAIIPDPRNDET